MEIRVTINGRETRVKAGATIMDAARQLGVYIPHFCYHPKLSIAANCRMCLVEVEKMPKPAPACATPAQDGMVVRADSPAAAEAQKSVMEFLLINHPLDCPICDQGGECQLQDLAVGYGISKSRYREEKRVVLEKNLGPLVATDMTRCIHCTRCVRFGQEVAGVMELGMTGRGEHAEIMPFVEKSVDSEISGNIIDVCPVGALTSKPFRYSARTWELRRKPGVAAHDSWGSAVAYHAKNGEVKRVVPRENEAVNQCWLSDRDRFSYQGLRAPDRAVVPAARVEGGRKLAPASWPEAADFFAENIGKVVKEFGPERVGFLASPRATAEEIFLFAKLARALGCENIDSRPTVRDFSGDDDSGPGSDSVPQLFGLGMAIAKIPKLRHALLVGANPAREIPLLALRLRKMSTKTRRRTLSVLGPLDLSGQFKVSHAMLVRPSRMARALGEVVAAAAEISGADNPVDNWRGEISDPARAIAKRLAESKGEGAVWLGAGALAADNRRVLEKLSLALADLTGAVAGVFTENANTIGARLAGAVPRRGAGGMNSAEMIGAKLKAYILLNCEPADFAARGELESALRGADFVAALTTHQGGIEGAARAVFPIAAAAETDGTFVNLEGRVQSFAAAATPPGEARPGWKALRYIGDRMGLDGFRFQTLEEVRAALSLEGAALAGQKSAGAAPRLDAGELADGKAAEQIPLIAAGDDAGGGALTFDLADGPPIYRSDMLVRRADALQATKIGREADAVFFNPDDLRELGVSPGDRVALSRRNAEGSEGDETAGGGGGGIGWNGRGWVGVGVSGFCGFALGAGGGAGVAGRGRKRRRAGGGFFGDAGFGARGGGLGNGRAERLHRGGAAAVAGAVRAVGRDFRGDDGENRRDCFAADAVGGVLDLRGAAGHRGDSIAGGAEPGGPDGAAAADCGRAEAAAEGGDFAGRGGEVFVFDCAGDFAGGGAGGVGGDAVFAGGGAGRCERGAAVCLGGDFGGGLRRHHRRLGLQLQVRVPGLPAVGGADCFV